MKKLILSIIFLISAVLSFSQIPEYSISGVATKRISIIGAPGLKNAIEVGERVTLRSIQKDYVYNYYYLILFEGSTQRIAISDIKKIEFDKPSSKEELWQIARIKASLDESILSKGYQYEMRNDLEDETIDAIRNFEKYYGFFNDEYLLDYIQRLLNKIHSITLNDGRPGNLTVKILNSSTPNAFCMPTGTVILTTGLLSTIRSEDELIGILAHETAHFVLDHQIININKAIARQKRADFWTGFSTAIAAATEIYLSEKNDYYFTGSLTSATAVLSNSIANSINERIGANYSLEQEWEADNAAVMTLTLLGKDPGAYTEQNCQLL
jgi:Zn-dependent protease with chaperone function